MSMTSASRASAEFNTLYTGAVEKWMGDGSVEDVIFEANQLLWLQSRVNKEVGTYGFEVVQPLLATKNTGVGWFSYDDSLDVNAYGELDAAKMKMAFLGGPLVITEQEEIENAEPHRRVNLLKTRYDQLLLSAAEEINISAFRGSGTNSKSIDGLEDMIFAGSYDTTGGNGTDFTRADLQTGVSNVYGGINRSTSGNEPWANYAADARSEPRFNVAAGSGGGFEGDMYKVLERMYVLLSRGVIRPDLFVSSLDPYVDMHQLLGQTATYERQVDTFKGIQLGHDNLKFRSAVWFYDESATLHSSAGSSISANSEVIYMMNTMFIKLCVEEDYDFAMTPFQTPHDSRVSIGHILWRGQQINMNPRYSGVIAYD